MKMQKKNDFNANSWENFKILDEEGIDLKIITIALDVNKFFLVRAQFLAPALIEQMGWN